MSIPTITCKNCGGSRVIASVELHDYELRALAKWHTDPARRDDMPPYLKYAGHIRRAAELIEIAATGQETS